MRRYIPHDAWILIDAENPDEEILANVKSIPGVRLMQVITPHVGGGSTLRDMGAVEYWLTPFPWVELYIIGYVELPLAYIPARVAHTSIPIFSAVAG